MLWKRASCPQAFPGARTRFRQALSRPGFIATQAPTTCPSRCLVRHASGTEQGQQQRQHYALTDMKTSKFAEDLSRVTGSGIACPPGCGKCCLSPTIESTPWDCGPMALEVMRLGCAEEVLARLGGDSAPGRQCIWYEPHGKAEEGKGRCSMYATRPLVCRLFGFATTRSKDGTLELAGCKVMKEEMPERLAAAKEATREGRVRGPVFSDEWAELHSPVLGSREATVLPINEALKEALQYYMWRHQLSQMSQQDEE